MPESEKPTLAERLAKLILREALGGIAKPVEHFVKRLVRSVALILGGIVIAVIGIAFVAVGAVRWLSTLMPTWLAWAIVGIILMLIGVTVTSTAYASGRS
ncbi:MAG TPA: phage holin family protein [Candidatus Acidoferrales bacterium]|nr:phage holin family protein [Candidatus Acidoferrales bacterium]